MVAYASRTYIDLAFLVPVASTYRVRRVSLGSPGHQPRDGVIATEQRERLAYMVSTWSAHGQHGQTMVGTWSAYGQRTVTIWSAYGQRMVNSVQNAPATPHRTLGQYSQPITNTWGHDSSQGNKCAGLALGYGEFRQALFFIKPFSQGRHVTQQQSK